MTLHKHITIKLPGYMDWPFALHWSTMNTILNFSVYDINQSRRAYSYFENKAKVLKASAEE